MSPQLLITISNQLEILADGIAEVVGQTPSTHDGNPLQPETVLVQSKGMQRWVSMAIAQRNGICANVEFPFPNAFLENLYSDVIGPLPRQRLFDVNVLTFRIMALLPQLVEKREFKTIRNYLDGGAPGRMLYQLAAQMADVFDQYQVFRPEMILNWESSQSQQPSKLNDWQPVLWNRLVQNRPSQHRAVLQKKLVATLLNSTLAKQQLPPRICVFGISHLPPFHLQVLTALSHQIPVYFFLLNPCRHYWGDILSDRQWHRTQGKALPGDLDPVQDLHFDQGNRLLASWGKQGKHFFNLIHQMEGQVDDRYLVNEDQTLLGQIQRDILDLKDRDQHGTPPTIPETDRSLQVHVCHSPMREVEVLYDQLIHLLEQDQDLAPRDILVMTPDIETYSPFIHSVFGSDPAETLRLPYTVADQGMAWESRLIEGFLKLLEMYRSRFNVSQVTALLEFTHIRHRFGLNESDLPKIEKWLQQANVCWGWNSEHRQAHQLPPFEQNTWRQGLDRLLLGYAMVSDGHDLFDGIMPQECVDMGDGNLLGALIRFVETLYHQVVEMPSEAPVTQWHTALERLLDLFFENNETDARDLQLLRDMLDSMQKAAWAALFDEPVPFAVIHDYLNNALDQSAYGAGFIAGSITFCAMLPMRSIPAKVICLLGLGHGAFPKDIHEPAFNLIAAHPRPGDRSKRDDDKYLFLEALISARKVFYLSYVGRSIQDNSVIPPSVVIDELLEYGEDALGVPQGQIVSEHPLQAFSKRYFSHIDPRLFSYSRENLDAGRALGRLKDKVPFFSASLEEPESSWRHCTLDEILAFYANPSRYIMEKRLGIYLRQNVPLMKDHENFTLAPLERYHVKQRLLHLHLQGHSLSNCFPGILASGVLPHGAIGQAQFSQLVDEVHQFVETLDRHTPSGEEGQHALDLPVDTYRLSGRIDGLYPEKRVVYRLAKTRPQDLLALFVVHLAMAATADQPYPKTSLLVCQDALWQIGPLDNPASILARYLQIYWQGLQTPLPFFPKTSYHYALSLNKGKPAGVALSAAMEYWTGNPPYREGESQDPYVQHCFDEGEGLPPQFEDTARTVFQLVLRSTTRL